MILEGFSSNEIQNVFLIGLEKEFTIAWNSSDSLGMDFNPILSPGSISCILISIMSLGLIIKKAF